MTEERYARLKEKLEEHKQRLQRSLGVPVFLQSITWLIAT
jgi:hypothetical protein